VIEMLVGVTILLVAVTAITGLLIHNARLNRSQQLAVLAQADARSCLSMIVQKMRSAGWDPTNAGFQAVRLDSDLGDGIDEIEFFADLDADGATTGIDEQVLIRLIGDQLEWRRSAGGPFEIMAVGITNDVDGDGIAEQIFTPDSTTDPTRVFVQITAEWPPIDPTSGDSGRFTVASDVVLRKQL
jgi:hypothetical protein